MLHEMREDLATSGGASTARRWVVQTRRRQSRNSFNLPHPCHSKLSLIVIVMFPLLSCLLRLSRFLVLAPFRHHLCPRDLSHAMLMLCTMLSIYDCPRQNRVFRLCLTSILCRVVVLHHRCRLPRESSCFMIICRVRFLSSCLRRNLNRI